MQSGERSTGLTHLIDYDVALCEAMADEMEDYLKSDVLFWEPDRRQPGGMHLPKLTFGGLLLALRRLATLRDRLTPGQSEKLDRVRQVLEAQSTAWHLPYRVKLARDLRSRLDTWSWYLDDLDQQGESVVDFYPQRVSTRVKIDLLLQAAQASGATVTASRQRQLALDQKLRADFAPGDFCWPEPLAPGFPAGRFWYLWGMPAVE